MLKEIFYDHFGAAQPNRAHEVLAAWEARGLLKTVITQNIDNLHFEAGSRNVVEFHGNSRTLVCLACGTRYPVTAALLESLPPRCGCGGVLKPDFVFFGEDIPRAASVAADEAARLTDCMLVVGSTGEVYPAALVPRRAKEHGAALIEINPEPSEFSADADVRVPLGAAEAFDPDRGGALPMKTYDLRSDTVTLPSPAMRKAMHDAEVGDDVYADDPTVNRLQEMAADITGTEAALFVSSGSMGNLIPVYLNCGRGNELLIDSRGHIVQHELASATAIAGAMPVTIPTEKGILDVPLLEDRIQPDIYYCQRTRMVALENTHNAAGGTYYPLTTLRDIATFARRRGLTVHLDGARLFNAVDRLGSVGQGHLRMRGNRDLLPLQGTRLPGRARCSAAGVTSSPRHDGCGRCSAAACGRSGSSPPPGIYALQHNVERLAEDHENARLIAAALAGTSWASLDPKDVPTNIIYFDTPGRDADAVVAALGSAGIRCGASGPNTIRFVTHLDVSRDDAKQVAAILGRLKLPA